MQRVPFSVVHGGLDWYGLEPTLEGNQLKVSEGVVGRTENPIQLECHGTITGGWRVDETFIDLQEADSSIEVILYHNEICLLVRTNDPNDVFPEELDTLFLLMWKEGKKWVYNYPWRDQDYGKDSQRRECHSDNSGTIAFL